jgi:uncharacterized membrane protein
VTPVGAQSPSTSPEATAAPPPTGLTIVTTYPSIEVDPGGTATFPLRVTSPTSERVDLTVSGVPEGFTASVRGGGSIVSSVTTTGTGDSPELELRVDVPDDAGPDSYAVVVSATSATETAELPVDLVVADASGGTISLTTDFPVQQGDSSVTFQFNLRLTNDTSQEITFGLTGQGPEGWTVEVSPSGQTQAATAVVGAGESQNIRADVTPARFAEAGQYLIKVIASDGTRGAEADLGVELTGSYDLTLTSADQRLNVAVTAGSPTAFAVVVANTGTAPLEAVNLTASAPTGWEVTFDTPTIDSVAVGQTATANAQITPAGNAVAGDYQITFTARNDQVSETMQVRATVETSTVWLFVGIGVIALVLVGLFLVFRRYGRR